MRIGAILRLIPDPGGELEIAEDGKDLDREWIDLKLNEFDDHALEEALLLKESSGATLTAIAIAGDGVDRMLQTALARGADGTLKIANVSGAALSSRAAAPLFAAAVRHLGCDIVLTGVQTSAEIHGQLAPFLGALLGWPHASAVNGISIDSGAIVARQEFGGGVAAALRIALPVVIGVQTASQPIRYISGTKLRQAMGEKIETIEVEPAAAEEPVELLRLSVPENSSSAVMLTGDATEIADRLIALMAERGLMKA